MIHKIHICLFDKECIQDWWNFGMPLRIYWSQDEAPEQTSNFTAIPGWGKLGVMRLRHWWLWHNAEEVELAPPKKDG